jgi:hypothetical protein
MEWHEVERPMMYTSKRHDVGLEKRYDVNHRSRATLPKHHLGRWSGSRTVFALVEQLVLQENLRPIMCVEGAWEASSIQKTTTRKSLEI